MWKEALPPLWPVSSPFPSPPWPHDWMPPAAFFSRVKYVIDGPAWLSAKEMFTRWLGSIAIWKKSARLRSELPSRPPVEICPVWFAWSVAWLSVKTGVVAWPFTVSATKTFHCAVSGSVFELPAWLAPYHAMATWPLASAAIQVKTFDFPAWLVPWVILMAGDQLVPCVVE